MLQTTQDSIRQAAKGLGFSAKTIEAFLEAEAEHIFEIEMRSKKYPAYRVQHNSKLGPFKGGIRFHPNVNIDEVRALATLMSLKTAAAGLPLGGGKGGIAVDPRSMSKEEVEELSRRYANYLAPHIGSKKDIPAPDINTNGDIMNWMADELEKTTGRKDPGSFTGKPLDKGGSEGREAATGRGGVITLVEYLKDKNILDKELTVALQGFGNVGYFFAEVLRDYPNLRLVAVANSKHTWVKPSGIDVAKSKKHAPRPEDLEDLQGVATLPPEAVIGVEADILVLAALEDAVTSNNVDSVKASIIVELANGPITKKAEENLLKKQTKILPDVIANAGGVIVSCLEWQQNLKGEHWDEDEVNIKLADILVPAAQSMLAYADEKQISYKQAAFELALKRLLS